MNLKKNVANYQSTAQNSPIWTQINRDSEDGLIGISTDSVKISSVSEISNPVVETNKKGLDVLSAAVFIAGEMAGSGVLVLPKAIVDSGWIGLILLIILCFNAGFGGTKLGECWDIIEERYPEHRSKTRNPYSTIAFRAVGLWGSRLVSACVQFTLFGAGTVYLLLSSQILQDLLTNFVPEISFCLWFLIIACVLSPAMWFGSPKDFRIVGIGAALSTALACVFMFSQIVIDGLNLTKPVPRDTHSFTDFFLSFGTILFAFGGASTFPTIQNDMRNKNKFSSSVLIAFVAILILYLPITAGGYFVYGENVKVNITESLSGSILVTLANVLMAVHLILAFLIVINPVCQEIEEFFQIPHDFGYKRCTVRLTMVCLMVFIGETIPKFGKILSLVGGSTITLLTFVFPCWFYMKLCNQTSVDWPKREIPLHIKVYLWELILIGVFGGAASTYSAVLSIFGADSLSLPCYWPKL